MSEDGECTARAYTDALTASTQAELKRRIAQADKAEENREADAMHYNQLLDDLVKEVSSGYVEKVMEAAEDGKRSVEVYSFDGGAKFGDSEHSLLFLTKGPRKLGQDFFLRLGIIPFNARLWQAVRPFEMEMVYDPEGNENNIRLKW